MTAQRNKAVEAQVAEGLHEAITQFALADAEVEAPTARADPMRRRRSFAKEKDSTLATLTLVSDDGVLRWVYLPPTHGVGSRRAGWRRRAPAVGAEIVHEFSFKETPPNDLIAAIERLDAQLTPKRGLRLYTGGAWKQVRDGEPIAGRVLLFVHGTFSKSEMFTDELGATSQGQALLAKALAEENYEAVLAFDHPTLSVSPWINALDLELELAQHQVSGPIDVICHSRGGLIVAWWLRNAKREVENVVFVGAPLDGTSLASPASLRSALQGLANVFKGLEAAGAAASTVVPMMGAVAGLSKIVGGVLQLGARTPLADAAVVIVPGLASQSRVGNNAELDRLNRAPWISTPTFHAVVSNFQPAETDRAWWEVWKLFRNPRDRLLNWGADAIFQRENDLVVDKDSMTLLCGTRMKKQIHDFGDSPEVHHCNYFRQPGTVGYLRKALKL